MGKFDEIFYKEIILFFVLGNSNRGEVNPSIFDWVGEPYTLGLPRVSVRDSCEALENQIAVLSL